MRRLTAEMPATGLLGQWWRLSHIRSFRIVGQMFRTDKMPELVTVCVFPGIGGFSSWRKVEAEKAMKQTAGGKPWRFIYVLREPQTVLFWNTGGTAKLCSKGWVRRN